jgi:opacity protein-like surface antigen
VKSALLFFAAVSLIAAERSGPYLSAGMGAGTYNDDGRLASVESRNVAQYRIGAGAFINKNLSVALDYGQFDGFKGTTQQGGSAEEYFKILSADVYGHYPLFDDQVDMYAKFGAGQIFWNETAATPHSSTAASLVFGAGVGVRPLPWLTFNVGYDFYQFGMDDNTSSYNMSLGSAYIELQVQF